MLKIINDPSFVFSISFAIFLVLVAKKLFRAIVTALDEKIAEIAKEISTSQKDFLDASTSLDDVNIENEKIKQKKLSLEKSWKEDLKNELSGYEKLILNDNNKKLLEKERGLEKQKEEALIDDFKQVTSASVDVFTKILQSDLSEEEHSKIIDGSIAKFNKLI